MKIINKMIIHTVLRIIFLVFLCFTSFGIFYNFDFPEIQDEIIYTNMEVTQNENAYLAFDEFTKEEQLKINLVNESNTYERFNVLLTSDISLADIDEYIYIKIDDKSYILEELLVKDNYYQIQTGEIKAMNKEIKIFLAINSDYSYLIEDIGFNFVNEIVAI